MGLWQSGLPQCHGVRDHTDSRATYAFEPELPPPGLRRSQASVSPPPKCLQRRSKAPNDSVARGTLAGDGGLGLAKGGEQKEGAWEGALQPRTGGASWGQTAHPDRVWEARGSVHGSGEAAGTRGFCPVGVSTVWAWSPDSKVVEGLTAGGEEGRGWKAASRTFYPTWKPTPTLGLEGGRTPVKTCRASRPRCLLPRRLLVRTVAVDS